ncbi:hypothetical protein BKA66DRAFT_516660 [Pyrenochaeta sp. MPI-SDFR-AT-0127]|nr:hypothetical protein BKA66DRAFT_516660 [Pyrenochaeta sp. MPI-SDFR-AT-0127]
MWRTGLLYLDRGDSAIMAALRDSGYNTQQSPGSPTRRLSRASDTESVRETVRRDILAKQAAQPWVAADANGLKFSRVKLDDPIDSLSPASDTTLFEEPLLYSLDRIKEDDASPDYFSIDGLERAQSVKTDRGDDTVAQQRPRPRHQRAPSTPSTPTINSAQRASRLLLARPKTNEGLLQLQANPTKGPRPGQGHQRKVSLGLPIKSPTAQAQRLDNSSPSSKSFKSPPSRAPPSWIQQERDLEYKHRHTFIGTASLDDFLEVLDVSPEHTTTKAAVVRAFVLLASSERLLARQASLTPNGWGLVSRTTLDTCNSDYVEQAHARLGSIILRQFLDLIPFNDDEEAGAMSVVEAFSAASHLDAGTSTSSKAKAFRSWMVRHST